MSTGTLTPTAPANQGATAVKVLKLAWTSDASGNVSQLTPAISGTILRVEFVPASGGSAPSTPYTATLLSVAGIDVFAGLGASLSVSAASSKVPVDATSSLPYAVAGPTTFVVSSAGNAKSGTVYIYYR